MKVQIRFNSDDLTIIIDALRTQQNAIRRNDRWELQEYGIRIGSLLDKQAALVNLKELENRLCNARDTLDHSEGIKNMHDQTKRVYNR